MKPLVEELHHFWICLDAKTQLIYVGQGGHPCEEDAFIISKDPSFFFLKCSIFYLHFKLLGYHIHGHKSGVQSTNTIGKPWARFLKPFVEFHQYNFSSTAIFEGDIFKIIQELW